MTLIVFFNRIKTNDTDEKKLLSSLQILIEYSSRNDVYADIYREALDMLVKKISEFQKERVKKSQTNKQTQDLKYFEYPPHIYDVIEGLRKSSTKLGNPALNESTEIVETLYNLNDDFPISIQVYDFMWDWIKQMVEAKYDEWIRQYWFVANRTNYSKWGYYDEERVGVHKFLEFHLMVGVLFLRWNRYDFIRYIFTFNSLRLPKYPLIPNSFDKIFNYCETFPWSEDTYIKCNLFKNWEGSFTENKIKNLFFDYIALLIVRLFDNTYGGSRELPHMGSKIKENNSKINSAKELIKHLEAIPNDTLELLNLKHEWKQDAKKLLEDFIEECKKREC